MPMQRKSIVLKSDKASKKFMVVNMIKDPNMDKWKKVDVVHFGAQEYSDFLSHKDKKRRMNYLKRHGAVYPMPHTNDVDYQPTRSRSENWTYTGWDTPGFWSRWLLWNSSTIYTSARSIGTRFDIKVVVRIN